MVSALWGKYDERTGEQTMNRDNVSEMARVMCGKEKDCLLCPIQSPCLMRNCAELLNAEGYRKTEDVAREIFEEIDEYVIRGITVGGENLTLFNGKNYAELKKKYESEGADE